MSSEVKPISDSVANKPTPKHVDSFPLCLFRMPQQYGWGYLMPDMYWTHVQSHLSSDIYALCPPLVATSRFSDIRMLVDLQVSTRSADQVRIERNEWVVLTFKEIIMCIRAAR
jgi:hypothetical protein